MPSMYLPTKFSMGVDLLTNGCLALTLLPLHRLLYNSSYAYCSEVRKSSHGAERRTKWCPCLKEIMAVTILRFRAISFVS